MQRFFFSFGFAVIFLGLFLAPVLALANTSVSIGSLSPASTVSVGTMVSFTVASSGFSNPSFNLNDAFSGSSVSNNNVNSSGTFSWTPASNDIGAHSITITVSDSSGNTGTVTENITVANGPTISIGSMSPGYTVVAGVPLSFTVNTTGFNSPIYTVSDSSNNSTNSVTTSDINSLGYFNWTPATYDIGTHTLTVTVVDSSGHSVSQQLTITVTSPQVTVTSLTPGGTVAAGQKLSFQIVPTGFTNPWYAVTDSFFGSSFLNGQMSSNVTWVSAARDVGTHTITIAAYDNANHAATDTITIAVTPGSGILTPAPAIVTTPTTTPTPATSAVSSSAATSITTFINQLVTGSSGSQVTALQTLLTKLGFFFVAPNGYFGPATKAAVAAFQTAHSLAAVGSVGPQTRALLNQAQNSSSYTFIAALSLGSQGQAVTALQQRLTTEGDFSGQITGYFGVQTETAVKKYQAAHDLEMTGSLGPKTRALLNK